MEQKKTERKMWISTSMKNTLRTKKKNRKQQQITADTAGSPRDPWTGHRPAGGSTWKDRN